MHDCSNEIVFADLIDDDKYRFHFFNPKHIIKNFNIIIILYKLMSQTYSPYVGVNNKMKRYINHACPSLNSPCAVNKVYPSADSTDECGISSITLDQSGQYNFLTTGIPDSTYVLTISCEDTSYTQGNFYWNITVDNGSFVFNPDPSSTQTLPNWSTDVTWVVSSTDGSTQNNSGYIFCANTDTDVTFQFTLNSCMSQFSFSDCTIVIPITVPQYPHQPGYVTQTITTPT